MLVDGSGVPSGLVRPSVDLKESDRGKPKDIGLHQGVRRTAHHGMNRLCCRNCPLHLGHSASLETVRVTAAKRRGLSPSRMKADLMAAEVEEGRKHLLHCRHGLLPSPIPITVRLV